MVGIVVFVEWWFEGQVVYVVVYDEVCYGFEYWDVEMLVVVGVIVMYEVGVDGFYGGEVDDVIDQCIGYVVWYIVVGLGYQCGQCSGILDQIVVGRFCGIGVVLVEVEYVGIDEVWIDFGDDIVFQLQLCYCLWVYIVDENVGIFEKVQYDFVFGGFFEIEVD